MSPARNRTTPHDIRPTHRTTRRGNRRLEILRTTAHLFVGHGYETTTIGDIAEANGISKPGLYYHFPSKQALLAAIIDLAHDQLESALEEIIATSTDPEERLRRAIHAHALGITRSDDAAFSILAIEGVNSLLPADRARITRRKRGYVEFLRDMLDELAAEDRVHEMDTTAVAYTLAGMVLWIPKWYKPTGRLSADRVADEITNLVMQSVLRSSRAPVRTRSKRDRNRSMRQAASR